MARCSAFQVMLMRFFQLPVGDFVTRLQQTWALSSHLRNGRCKDFYKSLQNCEPLEDQGLCEKV